MEVPTCWSFPPGFVTNRCPLLSAPETHGAPLIDALARLRLPLSAAQAAEPGRGYPGRLLPVLPRQAGTDDRSVRGARHSIRTLRQLGAELAAPQLSQQAQARRTGVAERTLQSDLGQLGYPGPPAARVRPRPGASAAAASAAIRAATPSQAARPGAAARRSRRPPPRRQPPRCQPARRPAGAARPHASLPVACECHQAAYGVRGIEDRPFDRRPAVRRPRRRQRLLTGQPAPPAGPTGATPGAGAEAAANAARAPQPGICGLPHLVRHGVSGTRAAGTSAGAGARRAPPLYDGRGPDRAAAGAGGAEHRDIAAVLGVPKGTVDTGLHWLQRNNAARYLRRYGVGTGQQQSA